MYYYGEFLVAGDPPWCVAFISVLRWLQLVTVLFSASIGLGLVLALSGDIMFIRLMRYAPHVVVPLATLLNMCMFTQPQIYHAGASYPSNVEQLPYCEQTPLATKVFAYELTAIVVAVLFSQGYLCARLLHLAPGSIVKRSTRIASKYLLALLFAFGVFVCKALLVEEDFDDDNYWNWHIVGIWTGDLHGFFNYIAFELHAQTVADRVDSNRVDDMNVGFSANVAESVELPTTCAGHKHIRRPADNDDSCSNSMASSCATLDPLGIGRIF